MKKFIVMNLCFDTSDCQYMELSRKKVFNSLKDAQDYALQSTNDEIDSFDNKEELNLYYNINSSSTVYEVWMGNDNFILTKREIFEIEVD